MKIVLGDELKIDLETLIGSKLLIQANSGGGKSYAVRKFIEASHGHCHQIIIDPEGEFASLREKFDFILAGKGGDIPADPRSAELLARKVLELKADLIVDLYELKHHDRLRFVTLFLQAMINAPKNLWHPVLIVLDEAHLFAPEKSKAESLGAVTDMMSRGRKRGFCLIPATQSLAKLNKDVAGECNNKLIGRTGLDIHAKRAAEELGLPGKEYLKLRDLNPGEFYAFGPAISKSVVLGKIGHVLTKHQKAGMVGGTHTPAPSAQVKSVLSKLTDLPQEAAQELKDVGELRAKVRELEHQLKKAPPPIVDHTKMKAQVEEAMKSVRKKYDGMVSQYTKRIEGLILRVLFEEQKKFMAEHVPVEVVTRTSQARDESIKFIQATHSVHIPAGSEIDTEEKEFGKCERQILGFLSMYKSRSFTRLQIGAMTGYSSGSGGFNNAISRLFQSTLILKDGDKIMANPNLLGKISIIVGDETRHTLEDWIQKLGACERKIYEFVMRDPESGYTRDAVADQTGYSAGSGGFNNAISRLHTLGLIVKRGGGLIQFNSDLAAL